MKKFLAALLAVLMVLSTCATFAVFVGAEEATEPSEPEQHRVTMSHADAFVDGWLSGVANGMLPPSVPGSKGCIAYIYDSGNVGFAELSIRFSADESETPSYDVSKYTYFVFDFYVSNAELLKKDNGVTMDVLLMVQKKHSC